VTRFVCERKIAQIVNIRIFSLTLKHIFYRGKKVRQPKNLGNVCNFQKIDENWPNLVTKPDHVVCTYVSTCEDDVEDAWMPLGPHLVGGGAHQGAVVLVVSNKREKGHFLSHGAVTQGDQMLSEKSPNNLPK
jgi:hypothetical protein